MKNKSIKIIFLLVILIPILLFAQTPAQRQELDQIKSDIVRIKNDIAEKTARDRVDTFFAERFGYIHQTNAQCIALVDKIESQAKQLKTPQIFSGNFASAKEAYSALEVLSDLMLREDSIFRNIEKTQEELTIQKQNIKSTEMFLSYEKGDVFRKFPKPLEIEDNAVYYESLWDEYSKLVNQSGSNMRYFISKCADINVDFSANIQERKNNYNQFSEKLSEFFQKSYEEEYTQNILSKFKPSENTQIILAVQSAFDELDRRYRNAIMLDFDYFKAIALIDSYENVANIILTRAIPRELNASIREEAEVEMKRRISSANNYKKIIKKEKPSYWLNKKLVKVQAEIKNGKIKCSSTCKKNLEQVPSLISASRIVQDISNEEVYSMLGYQALDLVKK